MESLPTISFNGKWLWCGTKLVAIQHIKYIEIVDDCRLCVTVAGSNDERYYTRLMVPEEARQLMILLSQQR